MSTTQDSPTAAGSGASASDSFKASMAGRGAAATSAERVATMVTAVLHGIHEAISEHQVTYPEYQATKAWMIEVGETGEWPLFLDVFVEHVSRRWPPDSERHQGHDRGTVLPARPGPARRQGFPAPPTRREGHALDLHRSGPRHRRDPAGRRRGRHLARRRGRLLFRVRPAGAGREPARRSDHWRGRPFRDRHHPARALPDPPRRSHRQADRGGRVAPLAAGAPAPDDPRPRAPHHHHTALLHRR